MSRFEWRAAPGGGRIELRGMVTGGGELAPLVTSAGARAELVLDVGGIRAFTSSGVQGWIDFLQALRGNGCQLVFERCSPAIVKQTCAIYDFLCGGAVRSLIVPYVCTTCDREAQEELMVSRTPPVVAMTRPCSCGGEMELDDLPQIYVALLAEAAAHA